MAGWPTEQEYLRRTTNNIVSFDDFLECYVELEHEEKSISARVQCSEVNRTIAKHKRAQRMKDIIEVETNYVYPTKKSAKQIRSELFIEKIKDEFTELYTNPFITVRAIAKHFNRPVAWVNGVAIKLDIKDEEVSKIRRKRSAMIGVQTRLKRKQEREECQL